MSSRGLIALVCLVTFAPLATAQEAQQEEPPPATEPAAEDETETPTESESQEPATDEPAPAEPATDESAEAGESAEGTAAGGDFDTLFVEWKEILTKLRELQATFQTAAPGERPALIEQYNELVGQGESLVADLTASAETVYRAAPNQDPQVADLLGALVVDQVRNRDDYENGLKLAGLLLENDYPKPGLDQLAGIAAFATADFDRAEQYLKQAQEGGALDETGQRYLAEIPQYREYWVAEQAIRETEAAADDLPRVLLSTNKGDIVIEMFENEAPNAVANFVSLVEKSFYNDKVFHRVLAGFMAQGGCPKGDGTGGPGYHIACESYQENHRKHFRGSLSMAHAGRDTGGSQFFLTFVPTSHLNGKHTVFGRVVEGMDVLAKLKRRNPSPDAPEPDRIVEAKVLRKRDHEYQPETLPETP